MDVDLIGSVLQVATSGIGTIVGAFLGYRLAISAHVRETPARRSPARTITFASRALRTP